MYASGIQKRLLKGAVRRPINLDLNVTFDVTRR